MGWWVDEDTIQSDAMCPDSEVWMNEVSCGAWVPSRAGGGGCVSIVDMEADPPLPAWGVENISDLHF